MLEYPRYLIHTTDTVTEASGGADIDDAIRKLRPAGQFPGQRDGTVEGADARDDQVGTCGEVRSFLTGCGDEKCSGHPFTVTECPGSNL